MLKLFAWRRLVILAAALLFTFYYFPSGDQRRQQLTATAITGSDPSTFDGTINEASTEGTAVSSSGHVHVEEALARTSDPSISWRFTHASPVTSGLASPTTELSSADADAAVATTTATPAAQTTMRGGAGSFEYTSLDDASLLAAETSSLPISLSPSLTSEGGQDDQYYVDETLHRIVYSVSTPDRQYFAIDWLSNRTYNANVLPHPTLQDQYVLVAQLQQNQVDWMTGTYAMHCTATFVDGVLVCNEPPQPLDIPWTPDTYCPGDPYPGPHDPRVFYGPNSAFATYGSRSNHNCHGMWVHDLQRLIPDFNVSTITESFPSRTDIQRPPPYREIEKNYFLFWDHDNNTYAHYDISPDRIFAQLYPNGAVGPNLALMTTGLDTPCLDTYMPKFQPREPSNTTGISYETIHQTANSLSITLCNRTDPACHPTPSNTFIMSIFQHKIFDSDHAQYFPYILLFSQSPPFAIHAISTKSIWIHGRSRLTNQTPSPFWRTPEDVLPFHSELFFVVSMAWRSQNQRYHGYMDDELMMGLGIEDYASAGIDVVAADLLQDLGYCDSDRVDTFPQ